MATLLYNRTCYSILDSTIRLNNLFEFAKKCEYKSIGICDYHSLHSSLNAFKLSQDYGIKAILGLEASILIDNTTYSFLLFAKNDNGFINLCKISSHLKTNNEYISFEEFNGYKDNLFIILNDTSDKINDYLYHNNEIELENTLLFFKSIIDDLYLSYSHGLNPVYQKGNKTIQYLANKHNIPLVFTSLASYEISEDFEAYKALKAIAQNKKINDASLKFERNLELLIPEKLLSIPNDIINNSDYIADNCNVTFESIKTSLPMYDCPNNLGANHYLNSLAKAGLKKRFNNHEIPDNYLKRLNHELNIINKMGFSNYFLIVYDIVLNARKKDIYIGPGRGSAPGSLVAYCLGITHIDPIAYGLLFERFLNPMRTTMPDIDIDVPDNKREDIIKYVLNKYGKDHVAHITSFGTLACRQVLNDLYKVYDINPREALQIKNAIPNINKITLAKAYDISPTFKRLINSSEKYQHLYEIAKKLEGLPKNLSIHAGGIVLSSKKLTDVVALVEVNDDINATQYSMEHLESLGLIKMDLLGIINLSIIQNTINDLKNKNINLDILKIDLNDKETFDIFINADTEGVFQSESEGMKQTLKKIKPKSINDIALALAIFRPGPMDNINEYLKRRDNPKLIEYPHSDLKPVLEDTYGIMVYQEQIMLVSQIMAGYSLAEADILRKAMSKKNEKIFIEMRESFIKGAIKNGYDQKVANNTFDLIEKFASYGFNKSHSVAYGLFAYQMAYLKAHYPSSFYKALLNNCIGRDVTKRYIDEAKKRNLIIKAPNINYSTNEYNEIDNYLYFPLNGIKNISDINARNIINERKDNGLFIDIYDCIVRLNKIGINKSSITKLIDAGALDIFGFTRNSLISSLDVILNYGELVKSTNQEGQISFDMELIPRPELFKLNDNAMVKAEKEKDVLGFYFSDHPIRIIKNNADVKVVDLDKAIKSRGFIKVIVSIDKVKQHRTKQGELMAFVKANDDTASYDFVFMPKIYNENMNYLKRGELIYIEGNIDTRDSCLVKKVLKYQVEK